MSMLLAWLLGGNKRPVLPRLITGSAGEWYAFSGPPDDDDTLLALKAQIREGQAPSFPDSWRMDRVEIALRGKSVEVLPVPEALRERQRVLREARV